ncbi:MAG: hypothetical protein J6M17_01855 [Ruminococcus sp.]|nr:hypothetical protein [Ruminococcus sp.]
MKLVKKLAAAAASLAIAGTMLAFGAFAEMIGGYDIKGRAVVENGVIVSIDNQPAAEWFAAHAGETGYILDPATGDVYDFSGTKVGNINDAASSETESDPGTPDTASSEAASSSETETTSSQTASSEASSTADTSSTTESTADSSSAAPTTSSTASSSTAPTSSTTSSSTTSSSASSSSKASSSSSKASSSAASSSSSKADANKKDGNPKTGAIIGLGSAALLAMGLMTVSRKSK